MTAPLPRLVHICVLCGDRFSPDRFLYTCPSCGGLLLVERDEEYVESTLGRGLGLRTYLDERRYAPAQRLSHDQRSQRCYPDNSGVWMWRDFILPDFPSSPIVSLGEGKTGLLAVPEWLGHRLGLSNLHLKLEGLSPSESFKDRGMSVAISDALRLQQTNPGLGIRGICCASTGDTSAAAAIYTAYVQDRLRCLILIPHEKTAPAQLYQAFAHGAMVRSIRHPDGFDGCMGLVQEYSAAHPEMVLVNSKNDMRLVGQETIALEILQDLCWRPPEWIAIPVGNGGNLTALLVSLLRARRFGLIDRLPGIICGQAVAADTLVRWGRSGYKDYSPGPHKPTVASAMNVNDPISFPRIRALHSEFQMLYHSASEEEILDTWSEFTGAGANLCPQSAVALSAIKQARAAGEVGEDDTIVSIATASAVKFADVGTSYHLSGAALSNAPVIVDGTLAALESSL